MAIHSEKVTMGRKGKRPQQEYVWRDYKTPIIIPDFPKNSPFARPVCTKVNWSYLAFPACHVYMPEGRIETLHGQGNVFFDINFSAHNGLSFTDFNSGISFNIGYPTIMELYKFLETLGMRLIVDHPYPEGFEKLRRELEELRGITAYSSYKREREMRSNSETRRQAQKARRLYAQICIHRLNYDENNRKLGALTQVLKGKMTLDEVNIEDLDLFNRY